VDARGERGVGSRGRERYGDSAAREAVSPDGEEATAGFSAAGPGDSGGCHRQAGRGGAPHRCGTERGGGPRARCGTVGERCCPCGVRWGGGESAPGTLVRRHGRCHAGGAWQEAWHAGVAALVGICMAFVGAGEGDQSGCELGVSQGALEETGLAASFEQMGGVGLPEGMDGHAHFGNASPGFGCADGALDTAATHGGTSRRTLWVLSPGGGQEPGRVTLGCPGGAEQSQRLCGQGDVPIFGALAAVDRDLEALTIEVGALQEEGVMEPAAQARDGGAGDLIGEGGAALRSRLPSSTRRTAGRRCAVCARRSARVCPSRWRTGW
jgi:hypothetical protein